MQIVESLQVARENFKAAESRIRDADKTAEAAELTRLTIYSRLVQQYCSG
ncbi:MAG: flagellin [Bdellovibrionota bacterium]